MGISEQQLKQLERRLGNFPGARVNDLDVFPSLSKESNLCVLGIDPSLRGTGFGVVLCHRGHIEATELGTIRCPAKWRASECLSKISQTIRGLVEKHRPGICVVEGLFHAQNVKTALIMAQARGAALSAAAESQLNIFEIAPRKVKQAIVGFGAAQKEAVAKMVQRRLNLRALPEPDAADALAVALAFLQSTSSTVGINSLRPF